MKHKHHIIPKHMGGTDDPSNLIELSVEEHAEAHRKLWEEHGNIKDYAAWKGLSGVIGKEEIVKMLMDPTGRKHTEETKKKISEAHKGKRLSEDAKEKLRKFNAGKKLSEEHKNNISKSLKGDPRLASNLGKHLSEETKQKLRVANMGNKNAAGPQKVSEKSRQNRIEATKERWRQYRISKGLNPDTPISKKKK